jgi:hypothetical protein
MGTTFYKIPMPLFVFRAARVATLLIAAAFSTVPVFAGLAPEEVIVFKATKARAEKGDPEVQIELADYYAKGVGVKKDLVQAFAWYQKAANQGHRLAQYRLANCYAYALLTKVKAHGGATHDGFLLINAFVIYQLAVRRGLTKHALRHGLPHQTTWLG